jgi:hypothetical protein
MLSIFWIFMYTILEHALPNWLRLAELKFKNIASMAKMCVCLHGNLKMSTNVLGWGWAGTGPDKSFLAWIYFNYKKIIIIENTSN